MAGTFLKSTGFILNTIEKGGPFKAPRNVIGQAIKADQSDFRHSLSVPMSVRGIIRCASSALRELWCSTEFNWTLAKASVV